MQLLPPRISRYDIKSLIGTGGMGTLYLARDTNPNTSRLVALKLLNTTLDSADLRERFAREARALAALNHPNVVNIYDSGEFQGSPFIVMEYVRGETLSEKIKRTAPLTLGQKLKLMEELCAGLGHAHDAGMIHRDIKPANLMVDQHGRLKILDFGIARVSEGSLTRAGLQVTQFNMRIGTPGYMSPEQIESGEIDRRSDIFAVGAVFYELLTCREAFTGSSTRQIENRVLQVQPAPLASLIPDLDPDIAAIVTRALEKDPANRYQEAGEMESAIEQQRWRLGRGQTPVPVRPTPPPPSDSGRKSRDSRAEQAFQRCVTFFREGAVDAARRSAIEALAEDSRHEASYAFLERLEQQDPGRYPLPRLALTPTPASQQTEVRTSLNQGTEVRTSARASTDFRTVVSGAGGLGGETDYGGSAGSPGYGPLPPTIVTPRREAPAASMRTAPPLWQRYRTALVVAAAVVVTAGVALLVFRLLGTPTPQGLLLTIAKPTGGTITARGINCGTAGNDCSTTLPSGDGVELQTQADAGFMFTGFTGDCLASGGRTMMTSARTCGGTFAPLPVASPTVERTLTISKPKGGTILSAGISCGTLGSDCSATHPDGEQITLAARADEGFTFQGFTGDCGGTKTSTVLMSAPRTCGATFIPRAVADKGGAPAIPSGASSGVRPTAPLGGASAPATLTPAPVSSSASSAGGAGSAGDGEGAVPAVITKEAVARTNIDKLLSDYCSAYEQLDVPAIMKVYPSAPAAFRDQFRQYKSAGCAVTGPPKYVALDADTGKAQIEVGVKMITEQKAGGGKSTQDLIAKARLARPEPRGDWHIEGISFVPKRQ